MATDTRPDLDAIVASIGKAGQRLVLINACEGGAGNISVVVRGPLDAEARFPVHETIALPVAIPELAGATFVATGSGCRLRDVAGDPEANLGCLRVERDGRTGTLFSHPRRKFARLTSELNSHMTVHHRRLLATGADGHALVHAHPPHVTFLSHIARYQDQAFLNGQLMRWEPETIIFLPEGIGVAPFRVPSSDDLMAATGPLLDVHQVVVWGKHGAIARSSASPEDAVDRIEYAETAARYEYMNLAAGEPAAGMSRDEILSVCAAFGIEQTLV